MEATETGTARAFANAVPVPPDAVDAPPRKIGDRLIDQTSWSFAALHCSVNKTGVVSISNAGPAGRHTITIRATDNCGAITDATFELAIDR
jgi:hypothetical protein